MVLKRIKILRGVLFDFSRAEHHRWRGFCQGFWKTNQECLRRSKTCRQAGPLVFKDVETLFFFKICMGLTSSTRALAILWKLFSLERTGCLARNVNRFLLEVLIPCLFFDAPKNKSRRHLL